MNYLETIILSTLGGTIARVFLLRRDYRQYPSYPQAWAVHLFLGFIAAAIGAIIIPAFLEKEFSAISFLLLAASQFREVRNVERSALQAIEKSEMVKRGELYIEGIARAFEARNYLAIWIALFLAISLEIFKGLGFLKYFISLLFGVCLTYLLGQLMQGDYLEDLASFAIRPIKFDGARLVVTDVTMLNVGLQASRELYLEKGLAAEIIPKDVNSKATLANIGQMQAIAHDVSSMLGVYMDVGEQEFTPLVRRNPATGSLFLVMIPSSKNQDAFIKALKRVPILEGAVRKPLQSKAGKIVD